MSAVYSKAQGASTFQLVAALEAYQEHAEDLARHWLDMQLYETVSREVEGLKALCASMPGISGLTIAVLMAHTELVHCLWRLGERPAQDCPELEACLSGHRRAVAALRSACLHLLKRR